jgi:hypothetical protein
MARRYKKSGMNMKFNRNFNIGRVVSKLGYTLLSLFVGGYFITELGNTMQGSCSPFYNGLALIGWKTGNNATAVAGFSNPDATVWNGCANAKTILYDTSEAGILTVIGLMAIGSIVMEFIEFKM